MNMMFNAVEFVHRLEGEGLSRGAAEAIANGIEERNRDSASKSDLADLATSGDIARIEVLIAQTASRQLVQIGGLVAVAVAIIGVIVGLK